jgi:hypothetical protein
LEAEGVEELGWLAEREVETADPGAGGGEEGVECVPMLDGDQGFDGESPAL